MSVDVEVERVIRAPLTAVAAYAGDPTNAPEWYANISSIEWRTEPPLTVGSELDFVARFLGRELRYTYRVVEHVADARLVMRTADGPFPMRTTYVWQAVDADRTLMRLHNRGEPSGFSKVTAPMMEVAMRRATTKDLARLAAILES